MSEFKKMWFIIYTNATGDTTLSFPADSIDMIIAVKCELQEIGYKCCDPFSIDNQDVVIDLVRLKRC